MFRPEIKVIDCSVRDGGLMNKWQFDDAFVCKVYTACPEAGVDYGWRGTHPYLFS